MDKYVLITNANTRLANEVIKKLISENFIVFAGDTSFEYKKFGNLFYMSLDTNSYSSLENAKKYIQKYTSKINSLIHLNNYVDYATMLECDETIIRESIEKNFMSIFKTNQVLWDLLEFRTGRIIHDCSDTSIFEIVPFNGVFTLAKKLLKEYNDILRRELKYKGINVVRIHTGFVKEDTYEVVNENYHVATDKTKLFYEEMNRFMYLNIFRDSEITVNEYCDFLVKIIKTKILKKVYYFKVNKKYKSINRIPKFLLDGYFKAYQK